MFYSLFGFSQLSKFTIEKVYRVWKITLLERDAANHNQVWRINVLRFYTSPFRSPPAKFVLPLKEFVCIIHHYFKPQ